MEASSLVPSRGCEIRKYGLIWFGAAISLAEIEAGLYCGGALSAVVLGHLLGGLMLFLAGMVGAHLRKNGMECTGAAFGKAGLVFFAAANVLQLIGWTAVMLAQGAGAASALLPKVPVWTLTAVLALLVAAWIFVGLKSFSWISTVTMSLLLVLVAVLTVKILGLEPAAAEAVAEGADAAAPPSFLDVFELSLAMPLSWLPLISDYTKDAGRPVTACATSAIVYTIGSLWMYALGMAFAALGAGGVAEGVLATGLGVGSLIVVLISTTTTTFLDAYSAGESAKALIPRLHPKATGCVVCALGMILAIAGVLDRYTDFLYLIASLFAPMAVVLFVSHFVSRLRKSRACVPANIAAFVVGFALYQLDLHRHFSPIGPSMTAILASLLIALVGCALMKRALPTAEKN